MLASLGFIVQEKFHPLFSGDGGPAIDQIPQLPVWLWVVMGGGIAAAESYRINIAFRELDGEKGKAETALKPGYVPGDLAFDPLNLAPTDPAEFRVMQEKELVHARAWLRFERTARWLCCCSLLCPYAHGCVQCAPLSRQASA